MNKSFRISIVLLAFVLVVQLFALAAPAAFAEGPADTAAVGWSVKATDSEGHELTLTTSEEVESALGKGFSVDFGKDAAGTPVTAPTVADLRRGGVTLTPPAGYTLRTVLIVADGSEPAASSRSLLTLGQVKTDAAGAVVLPAALFAESYDASAVGAIFNGSGERFTIRMELDRVDPAVPLTVRYSAGAAATLPSPVAAGGDSAELTIPGGANSVAYTVAVLDAQAESQALTLGKVFTGWKLSFSNGASAVVKSGDKLTLSSSAVLEAQWKDAIIFSFTGGEKEYDGTPLTASYTRYGEVKSGDELIVPDAALSLSRTDAGESDATVDLSQVQVKRGDTDVTGEYEFVVRPGKLRIVQRGITFTVSDAAGEYSAFPLIPSAYTISFGSLAEGHSATPTYSGQQTLPGTSTGSAVFTIRDDSGRDVSANYNISVINGSITVVPRAEKQQLTVTVKDAEKEYDGKSITSGEFELTSGSLLGSDKLVLLSFEGGITGVGEGSIQAVFAVKNGESDVTENYEISVVPGKLVIKPRPVTITADSAAKEFDGTALTKDSYALTSGSLADGHALSLTIKGSQTKVGSSANVISADSVKVTGPDEQDVTDQYAFTLVDGTLTVTAAPEPTALTITIKSAEKVYDGKALAAKEYEITSGALAEGDKLVPGAFSGELTNVGEKEVKAAFTVKNGETDVTGNYTITVVPGKLVVKPRPVTITADSATKEFDGKALTKDSYSLTSGSLADGHALSLTIKGSQTKVGSSANVISADSVKVTGPDEQDVTDQYAFTLVDGTLTVTAAPAPTALTITIKSAEKVYDGKALAAKEYEITSGTLAEGDKLVPGAFSGELTKVGEKEVKAAFTVKNGETDVTGNYTITVVPGKLVVKPRPVTITADSASKEFDGKALTKDSYALTSGSLADGHTLSLTIKGSQTKVGSSANVISAKTVKVTGSDGQDVTDQYAFTLKDGTLTVTAASAPTALTITIRSVEKVYDGKALAAKDYEITSGKLAEGDKLVPGAFSGELTNVGEKEVKAAFTVKNGETDVTGKYAITVVPGKLVVKPRPVTVTADSATKEFDGKALTKYSYTISAGSLVKGHTLALSISGSQTKVGSSANVISAKTVKVTDPNGRDVTAQYAFTLKDGKLTVTPSSSTSALTITVKSVEKVYDGKALAAKDYEITSGTLAEGDKLVPGAFDGELTNAGEKEVKAAFTVKNGETDVTDKYTITVVPGKLTVKARPITITAASASKIYDGRALTRSSWSLTSGELVSGHKLTATVVGSQTQTGSSANSISKNSIKITDASGADVTANYAVTTETGTLTVGSNPVKDITLTLGDRSKVYDGKAYRFTGDDIQVTGGTLPVGYRIDATFNPESVTDVGKYDVTIKSVTIRNASGADVTNQFNISRNRGSYTISERELVIETKAANKVYDGTPLTERSTPNITGRVEDHQVTLRITGTQTKVGSSDNTVADVKVTDKNSGADVTKNYAIRYQYGLLTVSDESGAASEGPTWVGGSAGTLFIKLDHDYDGFEGLQIDGKDLDRSAYTSASGSTEIWLKAAYLNTLSDGSHTLTAKYSSGESVETVFSIEGTQTTQTARRGQSGIWLILMLLALLGCLIAAYFLVFGSGKGRRWKRPLLRKSGSHKGGNNAI